MNTNTNENKTYNNSTAEFRLGNVHVAKAPVVKVNSDGSHRVTLMVSAGENKCFFLQDYVKAGVDPMTNRLATRVVGEALNVDGYLDGHVYSTQNSQQAYALSLNVSRVMYLTSQDARNALIAKRAAAAQQSQQPAFNPVQQPANMNVPDAEVPFL